MLRSLVLVVFCQPTAVEAVRRLGASEPSSSAAIGIENASLAEQSAAYINPSIVMTAWKSCHHCNSRELQTVMYYNIAKMDRKKDLGKQIKSLVVIGLSVALTMVNPALGLAFSVFAGLFGMGGVDPKEELIKKILEKVDKMISEALSTFVHSWNQAHIAAMVTNIQSAQSASDWSSISHDFSVPQIFNMSCYTKQQEDDCEHFRTKFGAGEALVTEIHYTQLMIQSWLEMTRAAVDSGLTVESCKNDPYNRFCDDFETYTNRATAMEIKIKEAANLLVGHVDSWEKYRKKDEHFVLGTAGASRTRPGQSCHPGGKVNVQQGYDKLLDAEFTGERCQESKTYCGKNSVQSKKDKLVDCRDDWIASVKEEIALLKEEVNAILEVTKSM